MQSQTLTSLGNFRWLGTPGHTQPPTVILHAIFPWLLSLCEMFKTLFPSRDADNHRILQSHWKRVQSSQSYLNVYVIHDKKALFSLEFN